MKKTISGRIFIFAVFLMIFAAAGTIFYRAGLAKGASGGVAGSVSDPLITKSYLEEQLSKISGGTGSFSKIVLSKGDQLTVNTGGQIVIYSGSAEVTGTDGLLNLTTGELFRSGNSAIRYHLYLSPADTSGIKASNSVTVFVWGGYSKK